MVGWGELRWCWFTMISVGDIRAKSLSKEFMLDSQV